MLPVARRALVIGLLGLTIQAVGFLWTALHLALSHWSNHFSTRHLMYEPGSLLIVVGFLVSLVCVPVALDVARASEDEVQIPVYAPPIQEHDKDDLGRDAREARRRRLARYSTETSRQSTGQEPQTRSQG
jgi:hypothetical protein